MGIHSKANCCSLKMPLFCVSRTSGILRDLVQLSPWAWNTVPRRLFHRVEERQLKAVHEPAAHRRIIALIYPDDVVAGADQRALHATLARRIQICAGFNSSRPSPSAP
jgi:hypothetical protein